jgi:hypothetical protein
MVRSQPGQIVCKTQSWKKPITKNCWWSSSRSRPWVQTPVLQRKKKRGLYSLCYLHLFMMLTLRIFDVISQ